MVATHTYNKSLGVHVVPSSSSANNAYENNRDYREIHRKLQNKKRDYALPQSDRSKNNETRWGPAFNELARDISVKVKHQLNPFHRLMIILAR